MFVSEKRGVGCESTPTEVSKEIKWEIIHGEIFDIFKILVLFPVLSGFEPTTLRVLDEHRTPRPQGREALTAKNIPFIKVRV